jgi:hypothetical protein
MNKYLAILLLIFSGSVYAVLQKGYDALEKGDYETALKLWRSLANQGNSDAQYQLGWMYHQGQGVAKDYNEASKWWHLAADQGNSYVQFNLGNMYIKGEGVTQDYQVGIQLFKLAAGQGDYRAQYTLGMMHQMGGVIVRDNIRCPYQKLRT